MDDSYMQMLRAYASLLKSIAAKAKVLNQKGLFNDVVDLYNLSVNEIRMTKKQPQGWSEIYMDYWMTGQLGEELEKTLDYQDELKRAMGKTPRELESSLKESLKLFKEDPFYQNLTYAILKQNGKI